MSNFFQLVRNEQTKLYSQLSTWILLGILVVIVLGFAIIMRTAEGIMPYEDETWKQTLQEENQMYAEIDPTDPNIAINNYRIENDLKPEGMSAWGFLYESHYLTSVLSLITIIVAGGILANEFRWGTIKLLLTRPATRTKIFFAKYASVLLFALTALIVLFISAWLFGMIFFGLGGDGSVLQLKDGEIVDVSVWTRIAQDYGLQLVKLAVWSTFAFMISAAFRNSALAIGTAIFLMFAGISVVSFIADKPFAKYILFANLDLTQFTTGYKMIDDLTLTFAIVTIIVYYLIFLVVGWVLFAKRDVAGH
ncbi:ABC-2 type transport system permease protein [Terribacillus halophilus]|uniref:ABC-2 type transport system permease protein n=1 Tax=Terribacillus halophilus TaxID=361279 RepID=A0A1G6RNX2_9BACI|nr:ABC-2 type transport system permease protein [Terribacillus halophilus]